MWGHHEVNSLDGICSHLPSFFARVAKIGVSVRPSGRSLRPRAAIMPSNRHVAELVEIGVPAPSKVTLFYEGSSVLMRQPERIEILGLSKSVEVEPLLIRVRGRRWLRLASGHTDRDPMARLHLTDRTLPPAV